MDLIPKNQNFKQTKIGQEILIAGDFNTDITRFYTNAIKLRDFIQKNRLLFNDILEEQEINYTYFRRNKDIINKSWIENVVCQKKQQIDPNY